MQRRYLIAALAALAIAVLALAGCSGGSSDLVSEEGPVPEGMPVMYEFFTPT